MMEVQWKRNVRVICDLKVGDKVRTDGFDKVVDSREHTVEMVVWRRTECESGFMIKISGYERPIDSNWLIKIPEQNG